MEGGGSARCRTEDGKWEREREGPMCSSRQCGVKDAASNGPRSSSACGVVVARIGENNGAWVTRLTCGTGWCRGLVAAAGVHKREKRGAAW
jgi:hypothetical protein